MQQSTSGCCWPLCSTAINVLAEPCSAICHAGCRSLYFLYHALGGTYMPCNPKVCLSAQRICFSTVTRCPKLCGNHSAGCAGRLLSPPGTTVAVMPGLLHSTFVRLHAPCVPRPLPPLQRSVVLHSTRGRASSCWPDNASKFQPLRAHTQQLQDSRHRQSPIFPERHIGRTEPNRLKTIDAYSETIDCCVARQELSTA
jgi:hypothetical protein